MCYICNANHRRTRQVYRYSLVLEGAREGAGWPYEGAVCNFKSLCTGEGVNTAVHHENCVYYPSFVASVTH